MAKRTFGWISVSLLVVGCGASSEAPLEAVMSGLVVERSEVGGRMIVENVSGSSWDVAVTTEEVVTIGIPEGQDEYMLAQPVAAAVVGNEVFALDSQDGHIRVYSLDGTYQRTIGAPGQGPGELGRPFGMVVTVDNRLLVTDFGGQKIVVYDVDGTFIEEWRPGNFPSRLFSTVDGDLAHVTIAPDDGPMDFFSRQAAYQRIEDGKLVGEPTLVEGMEIPSRYTVELEIAGNVMKIPAPFAPQSVIWDVGIDGQVVIGRPSEYRFEIHAADGHVTEVSRYWAPVEIDAAERDFMVAMTESQLQRQFPDFEIDESAVPATKPAYESIDVDGSGRIWVRRSGAAERVEGDCIEDPTDIDLQGITGGGQRPCWQASVIVDVFAPNGDYLGTADEAVGSPHDTGDLVAMPFMDENGTPQVRVVRLVFPASEGT